jgi:hypothetical protein
VKRPQLAAYALVVAVGAAGLWRVETTANEAQAAADAVARESDLRTAQTCITSYEVRDQIRDGIEKATRAGSEALIAVVHDADPQTVELFRQTVLEQVTAARATILDPDCDLAAARRVIDR